MEIADCRTAEDVRARARAVAAKRRQSWRGQIQRIEITPSDCAVTVPVIQRTANIIPFHKMHLTGRVGANFQSQIIIAAIPVARPFKVGVRHPLLKEIMSIVASFYEVSYEDIMAQRRDKYSCRARHVIMYLAKTMTLLSYPQIGREIGRRDHTTVMHAARKITLNMQQNPRLKDEIDLLRIRICKIMEAP